MYSLSKQAADYREQLPKATKPRFEIIFVYVAGSASILGIIFSPYLFPDQDSLRTIIYSIFLVSLVFILFIHVYLQSRRKLHRYSEAILFTHYVNHLVRDHIANIQKCDTSINVFDDILEEILDAIAQCFSMLLGKRCRSCIKTLNDDFRVNTYKRDRISKKLSARYDDPKEGHFLRENTDFENLWYALEKCSRFYLSNNLLRDWKYKKYKNSSFQTVGEPKLSRLGYVYNWNLNYRSALVLPIRFFDIFKPPKQECSLEKKPEAQEVDQWKFKGFLCIDCNSRNIFDKQYSPELGATFADILYIFFTQTEHFLNQKII